METCFFLSLPTFVGKISSCFRADPFFSLEIAHCKKSLPSPKHSVLATCLLSWTRQCCQRLATAEINLRLKLHLHSPRKHLRIKPGKSVHASMKKKTTAERIETNPIFERSKEVLVREMTLRVTLDNAQGPVFNVITKAQRNKNYYLTEKLV